jgi:hypothetical protein
MAKKKKPPTADDNVPDDAAPNDPRDGIVCAGFALRIVQDFAEPGMGGVQADIFSLRAVGADDGVTYAIEPHPISSQEALVESLLDRIRKQQVLPGWTFKGVVNDPVNKLGTIVG